MLVREEATALPEALQAGNSDLGERHGKELRDLRRRRLEEVLRLPRSVIMRADALSLGQTDFEEVVARPCVRLDLHDQTV